MSEDARITTLQAALIESKVIPKAEKDALADDLEYAQTINGDPDPTRQMMKRFLISGVRREMLAHERHASAARDFSDLLHKSTEAHTALLRQSLKEHADTCALAFENRQKIEAKAKVARMEQDQHTPRIKFGSFSATNSAVVMVVGAAVVIVVFLASLYFILARQDEAMRKAVAQAVKQLPAMVEAAASVGDKGEK